MMRRYAKSLLRSLLTIMMIVGVTSSASSRGVHHNPASIIQIIAEHVADAELHGHAHESVFDLLKHFHGHDHEFAEHDHNTLFVLPIDEASVMPNMQDRQPRINDDLLSERASRLEKPPRV